MTSPTGKLGASCLTSCVALIVTGAAWACPICHSDTARQVRAGIADDLWINAAALLLPFAAFALITLGVHYGRGNKKGL